MHNKTRQDIESSISNVMSKFLKEQIGEQVEQVSTELLNDTIIIRFKNILYPAEKQLAKAEDGKKMIKELKEKLIERARPLLEAMIKNLIGTEVIDIHSSFNPDTAERIEVFILNKNVDDLLNDGAIRS